MFLLSINIVIMHVVDHTWKRWKPSVRVSSWNRHGGVTYSRNLFDRMTKEHSQESLFRLDLSSDVKLFTKQSAQNIIHQRKVNDSKWAFYVVVTFFVWLSPHFCALMLKVFKWTHKKGAYEYHSHWIVSGSSKYCISVWWFYCLDRQSRLRICLKTSQGVKIWI